MARLEGIFQIEAPRITGERRPMADAGPQRVDHIAVAGTTRDEEFALLFHGTSLELHPCRPDGDGGRCEERSETV